jgi:hypothetical protein
MTRVITLLLAFAMFGLSAVLMVNAPSAEPFGGNL